MISIACEPLALTALSVLYSDNGSDNRVAARDCPSQIPVIRDFGSSHCYRAVLPHHWSKRELQAVRQAHAVHFGQSIVYLAEDCKETLTEGSNIVEA